MPLKSVPRSSESTVLAAGGGTGKALRCLDSLGVRGTNRQRGKRVTLGL